MGWDFLGSQSRFGNWDPTLFGRNPIEFKIPGIGIFFRGIGISYEKGTSGIDTQAPHMHHFPSVQVQMNLPFFMLSFAFVNFQAIGIFAYFRFFLFF